MTVAFNPQYLADGVEAAAGDEVVLDTLDALKPAVVRPVDRQDYLYLLMPVRVSYAPCGALTPLARPTSAATSRPSSRSPPGSPRSWAPTVRGSPTCWRRSATWPRWSRSGACPRRPRP